MFSLKLSCPCGFSTNDVVWGATSLFDRSRIGIPVYLPVTGTLLTHWVDCTSLEIGVDKWIAEKADRVIGEEYGEDAIRLPLSAADSPVRCPRCQCRSARMVVSGLS